MTQLKRFVLVLSLALLPGLALAMGTITGKVTDSQSGEGLAGANVTVVGTSLGSAADADGNFTIENVPDGSYTVKATFIGFEIGKQKVNVTNNSTATANFSLTQQTIFSEGLEVTANRAIDRETPVAFSNVDKEQLSKQLGSRDIPLVLNTTPSVYATAGGGGAGDARVNVRGFNQRNVAIMINGVPVNDMENGWVYWSNWDGVGDATRSIQVQRGLSAVNLATPSIGGTMNIITDPTSLEAGGLYKQEFGNDGFWKTTVSYNTGLLGDKFAFSANLVRKRGNGLIDQTWTDAWAYYAGASYNINRNNRLELYAIGAPQRHGQNLYRQNIGTYDRSFAEGLDDYDAAAFDKFNEAGRHYNQNWGPVSESYTGQQYLGNLGGPFFLMGGGLDSRFDRNVMMERENFFHKPQVNLNWFSQLSNRLNLYSIFYYSGGRGGGTGTYGDLVRNSFEGPFDQSSGRFFFFGSPWSWNWDATIAVNRDSTVAHIDSRRYEKESGQSLGILRNSRNNQWTIGAISKAQYSVSDAFKFTAGIDWRTAEIDHFREVRDLLGGSFFVPNHPGVREPVSDFWSESEYRRGLGDIVDYHFTNTVDWLGFFGQGEYSKGSLSAYGMGGFSTIKYGYTNHFNADASGNEITSESDNINGYQIKGGASYRLNNNFHVYGNLGFVSKVPIFDDVIDDVSGVKNEEVENQEFSSYEGGIAYTTNNRNLTLKANYYYTSWRNRTFKETEFELDTGDEVLVFLRGVDADHSGVEFEAAYQPATTFRLDAAITFADWVYTNDAPGVSRVPGQGQDANYTFYLKDLKVGDAPQTQFAFSGSIFPVDGLRLQGVVKHYRDHYADFNPFSRTSPDDRVQSWRAPNYSLVDLHASYDLPLNFGSARPFLFVNVFNLLDETYIQDAVDNSQFNAFDRDHDADDAEVYFGLPRTFNVGLSLRF